MLRTNHLPFQQDKKGIDSWLKGSDASIPCSNTKFGSQRKSVFNHQQCFEYAKKLQSNFVSTSLLQYLRKNPKQSEDLVGKIGKIGKWENRFKRRP